MRTRLARWLIVCSAVLAGCSVFTSRPPVQYYTLALAVPDSPPGPGQTSVVVQPFAVRDPYNQERIVYRVSPYRIDFYNYHQWAAPPGELVTDWTRRYLAGTGLFAKVLPTAGGRADLELGAVIYELEEIDEGETWQAALRIDFWLTRTAQRNPIWSGSYMSSTRAAKRNPEAFVAAMSGSLADILQRLVDDLKHVVSTTTAP